VDRWRSWRIAVVMRLIFRIDKPSTVCRVTFDVIALLA
jgi:hypothetical protein